jgi:hypothetical protein
MRLVLADLGQEIPPRPQGRDREVVPIIKAAAIKADCPLQAAAAMQIDRLIVCNWPVSTNRGSLATSGVRGRADMARTSRQRRT